MAGRLSLSEVDLTCPICCEIFRDPVVLKCSHSFCGPCLKTYWSHRDQSRRDCPVCRAQGLDDPVPSLTLKNLCEACVHEGEGAPEDRAGDLNCHPGDVCPLHGERLKLYCRMDKVPICVVCHTSRKHKQHDCCPVSEAIADVKEEMKSALSSLQERKEDLDKLKANCEEAAAHIQAQARFVEGRTREEFEKLHDFLRAEEEVRMEALRSEEEQKSEEMRRMIQEVERNITSMTESIRLLEAEMALEGVFILQKSKETIQSFQDPFEKPEMHSGALINVAKYIGSLTFHVWEKMQKIVKYTPVTLDPNSAAPWLQLSDDLTGVVDSDQKEKLPDNPERFNPDTAVLGSVGFASGKHAWDVNVGANTAWVVGVAKESVVRKEKVSSVVKNGYLCVYFYHNMYFAGTSPLTRLSLKKSPQRVGVQVDCEKGRVIFHDTLNNTPIFTFKHAITERVFPYFWVGCQQCPLTVEPVQVALQRLHAA